MGGDAMMRTPADAAVMRSNTTANRPANAPHCAPLSAPPAAGNNRFNP
ncbi:hypothetical protein MKCMC460_63000 (plasmid) [Mycobacterium sp. 20KCMC460]|uniref:Uncharacterized protein n=1 Tax=Mycobacterium paragordonae TaxID=1389713 RepID=A0ABQ1CGI5_9MYCO|nr:hypothetical protein MKCMC460_63000 [Mycobacterium sp. 20KCMC460]GFG83305.1 hypothetical protein MPRG_65810 [Mycobacterium paragordonae]GLC23051.1 hypothetical protein SRL2020472_56220 [Mycobacterium kiyosense]